MSFEFSGEKLDPVEAPKSVGDFVAEEIEAVQALRATEVETLEGLGVTATQDSSVIRMLDMRASFLGEVKQAVAAFDGMPDASRKAIEHIRTAFERLASELEAMSYGEVEGYGFDLLAVQKDLLAVLNKYNASRQSN